MGDIFSGGGEAFVNAAMRAKLAAAQVPFGITAVVPRVANNFGDGDETRFSIVISEKAAKAAGDNALAGEWLLTLSTTEARERHANKLLAYFVSNEQYGPCYLASVAFKSGKTGWVINDDPIDPTSMPATGEGTPFEGGAADDGIPY